MGPLDPPPREPSVVAVIPVHDEAGRIGPVVVEALHHLPVLVVDDGSSDDSGEEARGAGAVVIRQTPRAGKGAALKKGLRWALDQGYEAALTLDGDGQHDPCGIPRFLAKLSTDGPDLILGTRNFSQMPPVRRLSNELGRRFLRLATGLAVPDNQCGYRLLSRRLAERVLSSPEEGFELELDTLVVCAESGYSVVSVPVETIYSDEGSHIRPLRHTLGFARMLLKARKRLGPGGPGR